MATGTTNGEASVATNSSAKPKKLHLVLQAKGGAGKTFVSSLITQCYRFRNEKIQAIDLDPVNKTLSSIEGLDAKPWSVLRKDQKAVIDLARYDELVSHISQLDKDVVVDTGSTTFLSFNDYLITQDIPEILAKEKIETVIHCVIRGGSSMEDCFRCLDGICDQYPAASSKVFVWLNEVEGPIEVQNHPFEKLTIYDKWKDRIAAVIRIPTPANELYGADLRSMLLNQQTFEDAIGASDTGLVSKQRLTKMRRYFADVINAHI